MEMAMGRSKWAPSLCRLAGARLMVIFLSGKEKPELTMALRTRSLDSVMVLFAMPTMLKAGRPRLESPSTLTRRFSYPRGMEDRVVAIMCVE